LWAASALVKLGEYLVYCIVNNQTTSTTSEIQSARHHTSSTMSGAELAISIVGICGLVESLHCTVEFCQTHTSRANDTPKWLANTRQLFRQTQKHKVQPKDSIKDSIGGEQAQKFLIVDGLDELDEDHLLESGKFLAAYGSSRLHIGDVYSEVCYGYFTDQERRKKLEDRSEHLTDQQADVGVDHTAAKRHSSCRDVKTCDLVKHQAEWVSHFQEPGNAGRHCQNSWWQTWQDQPRRHISTPRALRLFGGILLLFPVCMVVMSNYAITSGLFEESNSWYRSAIQVSLPFAVSKSHTNIL
jgi:hypothetical protein